MASYRAAATKTLAHLAGAAATGARRAPQPRLRYATAARRWLGGTNKLVKDITEAEIVSEVQRIATHQWANVDVSYVEALMKAPDALDPVISSPATFFTDGVRTLFAHARLSAASEEEARALVLGGDVFGRKKLSITVEERAWRLMEALVAAAAELKVSDDAAVPRLFTDLTPTTLEFANKFIMRYGYEHGLRLELRMSHVLSQMTYLSGLPPVLQLRIPTVAAKQLASGPDSVLLGELLAVIAQFKSFTVADALSSGNITLVRDAAGTITGVKGPEIGRQAVSDALRLLPWGSRTPDSNLVPWTAMSAPTDAATLANWRNVSPNSVFFLDYQRIHNFVLGSIAQAYARTGLTQLDAKTDIKGSKRLCDFIDGIFDGKPIQKSMPEKDFSAAVDNAMDERIEKVEEELNEKLQHPDLIGAVGHQLGIRLVGTNQTERIIQVFEDLGLIDEGML